MRPAAPLIALILLIPGVASAQPGGPLPGPLPLFPVTHWWNLDISAAPLDPRSTEIITWIGPTIGLHPDFGGDAPDFPEIYGMVYVSVPGGQPLLPVTFVEFGSQSDAGAPGRPPGYPIPEEAKTQAKWIEGGYPGEDDPGGDRHMLLVDRDNRLLFELYHTRWNAALSRWEAGSGAVFPLAINHLRPETWTSADAAGLAILPGLVRYDEVYESSEPIRHALRFTVRDSIGHVFPASHTACHDCPASAPPMGARLRLKAGVNISSYPAPIQKIFQAMKTYGLIMADNGSDMYISGAYDARWDNDILNPAFAALTAGDFEVVRLGWRPPIFADVPENAFGRAWIEALHNAGVTAGCGANPLIYCPANNILREQMAVFLLRANDGYAYAPPLATGIFDDVPSAGAFAPWIEELHARGVTSGCGANPLRYCPGNPVLRQEMAVFLLKSLEGSGYTPPAAIGTFQDVPVADPYAPWIEELHDRGITSGCGASPLRFCPQLPVTRDQMAIFLTRTFGLPL